MSDRTLAQVGADISKARKRLRTLAAEEAHVIERLAACSLCKAREFFPCSKPSGGFRAPHAERRRAAKAVA